MSKPIESLAAGGADANAFREAVRAIVMDIIDDRFVSASAGAASAGSIPLLDGLGRLHPTILSPDGYLRVSRLVLSLGLDLGNLGNFTGTAFDSALQIHSTDQLSNGLQSIIWGNHSKPSLDYYGKSRGNPGEFSALVLGDVIYRKWIQGTGLGGSFGHVGYDNWIVDATPTNVGELGGRYEVVTGSGLHLTEADLDRPTYFGLKKAFILNRRQQGFVPGQQTIPGGPGTLFPAIWNVGKCGPNPGELSTWYDLTGAVLALVPVPGGHEVGPDGEHYRTNLAGDRHRFLTTGDEPGCHVNLPVQTGDYVTTGFGAATSTVIAAADLVMTALFYPKRDVPVSDIAVEVTAGMAGNLRIMIHADDGTGTPGALIDSSGDISTAAAGIKTWAGADFTFLRDTRYWISVHTSAGPTLRASSANGATPIGYDGTSVAGGAHYIGRETAAQAYAAGAPADVEGVRVTSFSRLPVLFSLKVA